MKHLKSLMLVVFVLMATARARADISTTPVTASTDAAKNLYAYFYDQYGRKTVSSIMADVNWNTTLAEKVQTLTGKYPAMNCFDFIHIYVPNQENKANGWINYYDITPVTSWANAGGIVQLMWHFNVPLSQTTEVQENGSGVTCSPSETTFRAKNVFTEGSWERQWFYGQMDKVIEVVLKLQEAGIAATWRPFHEAAGNATAKQQAGWTTSWFWWGYEPCTTTSSRKVSTTSSGFGLLRTTMATATAITKTPTGTLATNIAIWWLATSMATMPTKTYRSSLRFRPLIPTRW